MGPAGSEASLRCITCCWTLPAWAFTWSRPVALKNTVRRELQLFGGYAKMTRWLDGKCCRCFSKDPRDFSIAMFVFPSASVDSIGITCAFLDMAHLVVQHEWKPSLAWTLRSIRTQGGEKTTLCSVGCFRFQSGVFCRHFLHPNHAVRKADIFRKGGFTVLYRVLLCH